MTRHARHGRERRWPVAAVAVGALLASGAVAAAGTGLLTAPGGDAAATAGPPATATATAPAPSSPTPSPTPTPPPDVVLTLVAAGDVLPHQPVIASARTADGSYDFTPLMGPMRPFVEQADLALCHMEVPIAPPGTQPSGYPVFGAPRELARDLRAVGWDGCSTASNHSLDRGLDGAVATLDAFDEAGLGHVGTARSQDESAAPQLYDLRRDGGSVRVAHLAATYGTNGIPVPAAAPWSVRLIDTASLVADAAAAREAGADLVVVSVHCCVEYVSEPTAEQVRIAQELASSGAVDLLLGHHAHVPQPVELVPGGPDGGGMWVAHGLGNMLSNQDENCCPARTDSGLLVTATVRKPHDGPARVTGVEWTALTVDRAGGHRVHPMTGDAPLGTLGPDAVDARFGRVAEVVGPAAPHRTTPPEVTGPAPTVLPRPRG